jgi:hypothetical protein
MHTLQTVAGRHTLTASWQERLACIRQEILACIYYGVQAQALAEWKHASRRLHQTETVSGDLAWVVSVDVVLLAVVVALFVADGVAAVFVDLVALSPSAVVVVDLLPFGVFVVAAPSPFVF